MEYFAGLQIDDSLSPTAAIALASLGQGKPAGIRVAASALRAARPAKGGRTSDDLDLTKNLPANHLFLP